MPRPISQYSTRELQNLVKNHRDRNRTGEPLYLEAFEELSRRTGQGFDFKKSLDLIRAVAAERRFISYKELANASGLEWSKVRYAINTHLGDLIEYAHRRGLPLLSAVVVNTKHVETGAMEPKTLAGFVNAARDLGYSFSDAEAFPREQQQRVFDWAAGRAEVGESPGADPA